MECCWKIVKELSCQEPVTHENFWNGLTVWIERPHLLNRRLLAAELLETRIISQTKKVSNDFLSENILKLFEINNLDRETINDMLENLNVSNELIEINFNKLVEHLMLLKQNEGNKSIILIRNLLSRNMKLYNDMTEVTILDTSDCTATFYPMKTRISSFPLSPVFPYRIKHFNNRLILEVYYNDSQENSNDCKAIHWLSSVVLPKVYKWCMNRPGGPVLPSLSLISAKLYNTTLHRLKEKYGKYYTEIWPKYNNTDPLKFVYEDISICSYLITLWEEERAKSGIDTKQTFLDIGCGNGLLVDILIAEGYEGIGVDLRKRKIWDAFTSKDKLVEMAIDPCSLPLFPNYDWIIGNHPDELTPWIPLIAARSSYKMKIFLMPCCYYTFNGKYSDNDVGLSRYQSYLKFIQNLCGTVGFNVQQDKLRIPSTKRICFICASRSYEEEDAAKIEMYCRNLINQVIGQESTKQLDYFKLNQENKTITTGKQIANFKPREKVEPVRNCTNLDREKLNNIVLYVVNILLKQENFKDIHRDGKIVHWNAGGMIKLKDLINLLEPNILCYFKNQNGGFQTFLRNHKNVFEIRDGCVQLRIPVTCSCLDSSKRSDCPCQINISLHRTKECFFYFYHPQGCPLSSLVCTFSHKKL